MRNLNWVVALLASWLFLMPLTPAMVIMDEDTIDHAIRYGAKKAGRGYEELLGPNWKVGPEGTLLNIYTPYMLLAGKAYNAKLPPELDYKQLKEARKLFTSEIRYIRDTKEPQLVKFAVSLLGETVDFPPGWKATIDGVGNGRGYTFKPYRVYRPKEATKVPHSPKLPYEAVISYYFKQADLMNLQGDYRLTLSDVVSGKQYTFKLNNDDLY